MRRNALLLLILAVLTGLTCITSCWPWHPDSDANPSVVTPGYTPPVVTQGYRLFKGDTEGLLVSFEYPDSWVFEDGESNSIYADFHLRFGYQNSITLQFSSEVSVRSFPQSFSLPPSHFKNASDFLEYKVSDVSGLSSFQSISKGKYKLGNVEGEEASYSFLDIMVVSVEIGTELRQNVIYRHVVADYEGRIYWVRLRVNTDVDKFEDYNPDFEHLLATFKFLE